MSSSRAPPPAPLNLTQSKQSFDSSYSERGRSRHSSFGDASTLVTTPSTAGLESPHHSNRKPNNVNVYTTCGRHTDEFLFGGPSLGEMARSLFGRNQR